MLSALVGIAIREGYLTSPHQRISDILPDYFAVEANWPKKTIKLQGLLTQTDGLLWNDDDVAAQIEQGADWVQTIIDMDYHPGPGYHYNTGQSHITSAMLANASGMNTCELAYRYLFDPLDISVEHWGQDPQGIFIGGWNLFLTPRELAKFGLLYLHGGEWQGSQVIPAEWVEESLSRQVEFYGTPYDYGYLWWLTTLDDHPVYAAVGHGGQMIAIIPDLDVIVVTTGDVTTRDRDAFGFAGQYYLPRLPELHGGVFFPSDPFAFMRQYVIPAVESGSSG
jgi:CubicO group peptidase (beta-lactamase class C family)